MTGACDRHAVTDLKFKRPHPIRPLCWTLDIAGAVWFFPASVDTPGGTQGAGMGRRKRRAFTPEFKAEAVRLANLVGT
ncbi:hypothetical protein BE21_02625 [Sorangium cellulosum]|uniref:Transposase n=1 Tax=Sorangium cellulosum TaxID=56 RepID=A0A150TRI3_SORCE|nr:hypothetical protein BE21_02625 [Sorangium cellulosum]